MAIASRLLVEGRDDMMVIRSLMDRYGLEIHVKIDPMGGIDGLLEALPTEIKASDLERLGVVVDADTSLADRWRSLRSILTALGYAIPDVPDASGSVICQTGLPTIGIWLMPDKCVPGILEDFIRFIVPEHDALWSLADASVAGIPAHAVRFPAVRRAKVVAHTWLAWQEEPGHHRPVSEHRSLPGPGLGGVADKAVHVGRPSPLRSTPRRRDSRRQ